MTRSNGPTARRRRKKHRTVKAAENANKTKVRVRDALCRFPKCGCWRFNYFLAVSHQTHKGMGGDSTGERSQPEIMILVCSPRHREHRVAIDKGVIRWRPLTTLGAEGPIAWDLSLDFVRSTWARANAPAWAAVSTSDAIIVDDTGKAWLELAREFAIRHYEPFTEWQHRTLTRLAEMDL